MMSSHHPADLDSATNDSVASSPRSDHNPSNQRLHDDALLPRVRFMCSFGGKILPRPHDNQLRYVGGDTRMVAVHRHTTFSNLLTKLSKLSGFTDISVKYQLPNEDLDALITVTTDEDVENMMDEYERFTLNNIHSKTARLRLFLFSTDADSRTSSISSLLDGSTKRENWFLDALNGRAGSGLGLERGRSEVSSIVSEVPDYLFGLDNSDEQPRESKFRTRPILPETISNSDPGSPTPIASSPFCSTSSSLAPPYVPSIPGLPPVKTKPDNTIRVVEPKEVENFSEPVEQPVPQITGNAGKPTWNYVPDSHYPGPPVQHIPVYYVPGPVPPGSVPVQPVPIQAPYFQQFPAPPGQIPVGFRHPIPGPGQVYGTAPRPVTAMDTYDMSSRVVPEAVNQTMYYGVRNAGVMPAYPGMVVPVGEELPGSGTEAQTGRVFKSS